VRLAASHDRPPGSSPQGPTLWTRPRLPGVKATGELRPAAGTLDLCIAHPRPDGYSPRWTRRCSAVQLQGGTTHPPLAGRGTHVRSCTPLRSMPRTAAAWRRGLRLRRSGRWARHDSTRSGPRPRGSSASAA